MEDTKHTNATVAAFKKIKDRLYAESNKWLDVWKDTSRKGVGDDYADGMNDAFDEALSIVSEVETEYVNKSSKHINKLSNGHKSKTSKAFEKIIEELEAKKQNALEVEESIKEYNIWKEAIEIVNRIVNLGDALASVSKVEAEFNNGWHPCGEGLPEEPGLYLLSYENPNCIPTTQLFDGTCFRDCYGGKETQAVAWMPIPESWKPVESKSENKNNLLTI